MSGCIHCNKQYINKKLINVSLLFDKLYKKFNKTYVMEHMEIGDYYNFVFIHVKECELVYISMEDYDGWDNFGDEDNNLTLNFMLHHNKKSYDDIKDNHDRMFISHSIKDKDIYERYINKQQSNKTITYINYESIKDWAALKTIDINDIIFDAKIEKNNNYIESLTKIETLKPISTPTPKYIIQTIEVQVEIEDIQKNTQEDIQKDIQEVNIEFEL